MTRLRDILPPVYGDVLPEMFDREAIEETRATCGDCAMIGDEGDRANVRFVASTKCCTFQPQLPNYLVGALLEDASAELEEGRRRMRAHIATRTRITPRWVAPSRRYRAIYRAARFEAFGRSEALRCAYYDDGDCTIWRYRESYCSTFFCKHDAGEDGRQFWRQLRRYLDEVEKALARHLVKKVAPELEEPKTLMTLEELERRPPHPDDYRRWWGDWEGREEELYRACAQALQDVTRSDLEELVSVDAKRRLPLVEQAHDRAGSLEAPEELRAADDVWVAPIGNTDDVRVTGYSEYDPLVMPAATLERIRADPSALEGELRLKMARWRILVTPDRNDI